MGLSFFELLFGSLVGIVEPPLNGFHYNGEQYPIFPHANAKSKPLTSSLFFKPSSRHSNFPVSTNRSFILFYFVRLHLLSRRMPKQKTHTLAIMRPPTGLRQRRRNINRLQLLTHALLLLVRHRVRHHHPTELTLIERLDRVST